MANDLTTGNPLFYDAVSTAATAALRLWGIVIYPTAASWDIIIGIDSTASKVVFQAFGTARDPFFFLFPPDLVKPLYVTTITNCKAVVYLR